MKRRVAALLQEGSRWRPLDHEQMIETHIVSRLKRGEFRNFPSLVRAVERLVEEDKVEDLLAETRVLVAAFSWISPIVLIHAISQICVHVCERFEVRLHSRDDVIVPDGLDELVEETYKAHGVEVLRELVVALSWSLASHASEEIFDIESSQNRRLVLYDWVPSRSTLADAFNDIASSEWKRLGYGRIANMANVSVTYEAVQEALARRGASAYVQRVVFPSLILDVSRGQLLASDLLPASGFVQHKMFLQNLNRILLRTPDRAPDRALHRAPDRVQSSGEGLRSMLRAMPHPLVAEEILGSFIGSFAREVAELVEDSARIRRGNM